VLTGTVVLAAPPPDRAPSAPGAQSDLDAFMQKVLARRDENWKKLQQYILDERQQIDVRGPANFPIWGEHRDFSWYIRDGYFVQSPVKINGATVAEADRRKYEDDFLRRAKARDKRATRGQPEPSSTAPAPDEAPEDVSALLQQTRQPAFIDSAYFLRFKFEQGNYALVGRESFNGRDVLRIEYYPERLFSHEQDAQRRRQQQGTSDRGKDVAARTEQMMNKVSLVTVWVEPQAFQIVKYTFANVSFDFLPAAWLLRVNDAAASMVMSQPFKDVWLPDNVEMHITAMLAVGAVDVRYRLDYHDYKQADASGRIKRSEGR
jgi:hypothetical protein